MQIIHSYTQSRLKTQKSICLKFCFYFLALHNIQFTYYNKGKNWPIHTPIGTQRKTRWAIKNREDTVFKWFGKLLMSTVDEPIFFYYNWYTFTLNSLTNLNLNYTNCLSLSHSHTIHELFSFLASHTQAAKLTHSQISSWTDLRCK